MALEVIPALSQKITIKGLIHRKILKMTDLNPNRVLPGKAGAGRFDHKYNTESEIDLIDPDSDAAYNADGSWFFPPKPRSASQSADFWEKSKVPDEVLYQFLDAYKARFEEYSLTRWREDMGRWAEKYKEENPEPTSIFPGAKKKWDADFHEASKAAQDEIALAAYSERPSMIARYDARPLARAAQMYMFAPSKHRNPEEYAKAMSHPVELFDETLTVQEIERKYGLSEITSSLTEITQDTSKQDDLIDEVTKVKGSLEEMNTNYVNILEALHLEINALSR